MDIEMEPPPVLNIVIDEQPSKLILNLYSTLRLKRTIVITQKAMHGNKTQAKLKMQTGMKYSKESRQYPLNYQIG